jgi:hypothetical protein
MSRAYRIRVSESLTQVIRAGDHVSTRLEVLEILPAETMADLLRAELVEQGFEVREKALVRTRDGITVEVDPATGTVTVRSETEQSVELKTTREGHVYDDDSVESRRSAEERLREVAKGDLDEQAAGREKALQKEVTDRLERQLADVQRELGGVVNRVTAEALKQKAAQLGEIRELTEDPETGNLTIVLEV